MVNTDDWSARKKTLYGYLKRAFDENRGAEAILQYQWMKARVAHENEAGVKTMKRFNELNSGQPRAIRALNLIEEMNGSGTVHRDASAKKTMAELMEQTPPEQQIIVPRSKFNLEFEEVTSAYQMACEAEEQSLPVILTRIPVQYYVH